MSETRRRARWRAQAGRVVIAIGVALPLTHAAAALNPPAVPELVEGAGIIKNKKMAIVLGKALFWDQQAGSDGMACASCHFHAGADSRIRNQLSPGLNDVSVAGGDPAFGSIHSDTGDVQPGEMLSGNPAGPNYTLTAEDFPLHKLSDYRDRNSPLVTTTNDSVSSAGAFGGEFTRVRGREDQCSTEDGSIFLAGGLPARGVEPRNTPTTINAAFFHSNFWDGRANNLFNGVGVFGLRDIAGDPAKRLIVLDEAGVPKLDHLRIRNASLASQAVAPPLSVLEMSCDGRTFADVGRKLLSSIPLFGQRISKDDSVLGPYVSATGKGLKLQHVYSSLIAQAFEPKYWAAPGRYRIDVQKKSGTAELVKDSLGYTQMEINFSMFWGLSIMLYEQTLISDQSRFDTWFASCRPAVTNPGLPGAVPIANPVVSCLPASANPNQSTDPAAHGFTAEEALGFGLFNNGGVGIRNPGNPACAGCHGPIANPRSPAGVVYPVMSEAAFQKGQTFVPVERSRIDDPGIPLPFVISGAMHDRGFFNIGVRPTHMDAGNGGFDPHANPLAISRMFLSEQAGETVVDPVVAIDPAAPGGISPINRCLPGVLEPGGTPPFPGCSDPNNPALLDQSQERELVDGGLKTPSLRNVALTPPYFHSGTYADLRSVVEFYARGGSKRNMNLGDVSSTGDTSGSGPLGKGDLLPAGPDFGTNVDFFIRDIMSTEEQIDAMVAFMLTLTDPRVQCDAAPFDHPELIIFHGHSETDADRDGKADDITATLPAVGANGYAAASGYCIPNKGDLFAPGMQGRVGGARVPLE